MICSSKSHDTDEHPASEEPKCVNCKGDHPSDYKACNTRCICLGLKPIPTAWNKAQHSKEKSKGKGHEIATGQSTAREEQLNIGLTDEDISNIMKSGNSPQARKENTAKFIQSHMNNLNKPAEKKPQNMPDPAAMETEDDPSNQPPQ